VSEETYEDRLEREIRERVEEELKRARREMKHHREELEHEAEELKRDRQPHRGEGSGSSGDSFHIPLPDVDKVSGLLEVVAEKIPVLLGGLRDLLYSPKAAENMADSVATFYKRLSDAGIPQEQALEMARGYMINLRDVLGKNGLDIGRFAGGDDE